LGVKKMSKQVDESLFDQKPEEQAPPAPAAVSTSFTQHDKHTCHSSSHHASMPASWIMICDI